MEVVLNMGIFRNIDLISQGYYEVQIQIYTEQDWIFEEIKEQQTIKTYARYVNKDPKTCQNYHENSENPHQYTTESFCIGYERENAYKTINMLEFQHKIFLPMDYYKQDDLKVPIYCRAKLFHIPIELFKTSNSSKPSFIEVDQKEFKIGNALIGAYKYLQLEFQAPYACALETSIHCCILKLELTSKQ
ncbi:unnamed protein product [Moneuplotes crassus]|uniref:Uncharacterized protein n=1 Tax=Euplotes crassus TaxID=5936 RepID=A0AAD2D8B2_EUPCR|nr:unnamed protein product [Moneuplotes crassus]